MSHSYQQSHKGSASQQDAPQQDSRCSSNCRAENRGARAKFDEVVSR